MCPTVFAVDLAKAMRYSGTLVPLALHEQSCYVDSARNKLVQQFLRLPPHEATHLLMIDVDTSFPPDSFMKTLHLLEAVGAEVLFGNYALGNCANSVFGPPENAAKEAAVLVNLKPNQIYSDIGTGGTGWVMMTRRVLERMQAECPGPWHWFARDPTADGKDLRGEDVSFGLRLWDMKPRPKVMATTHLFLRHFKMQPFIPDFMQQVAMSEGVPAMAMPNPYEADKENYYCNGNVAMHKRKMTPEEIERMQREIAEKAEKEAKDATVRRGNAEVESGGAAQRLQDGQEGDQPEASNRDHVEREAQGSGGQEGVPAEG